MPGSNGETGRQATLKPPPRTFDDLRTAEREAVNALTALLEGPQRLAWQTHLAIGRMVYLILEVEGVRQMTSARVVIQLLNRSSNDLRCAALLADHGYPSQAATVCASMFEAILTAAFIGRDEELAQEWLDHDQDERSFRPVKALISHVAKGRHAAPIRDNLTKVHRGLCMPKHANPRVDQRIGADFSNGAPFLRSGPDVSRFAIDLAWYALLNTCRCAAFALAHVGDAFLAADVRGEMHDDLQGVLAVWKDLNSEFKERVRPGVSEVST
jgi:hypothetical protein